MSGLLEKANSRRLIIVIVTLVLCAFQDKIGIGAEAMENIVKIGIGGVAAFTLEDTVKAAVNKKKK